MEIPVNLQDTFGIVEKSDGSLEFKSFDEAVADRSVVDAPGVEERARPVSDLVLQFAQAADEFVAWGTNVVERDRQLREFWTTEPLLTSAVYSVTIRNASFAWIVENTDKSLKPHKNTIAALTRMLENADRGKGWDHFVKKICVDLYTQDNGAFVEIIRREDKPNSPVLNIAHLDSHRCQRTGDPEYPVIYRDRHGKEHRMAWYQVATIEEFPSAVETLYGVQVCAVSRALRAAQIMRDISIYKHEKISGRNPSAMHIISGVQQRALDNVTQRHEENMLNMGLMRYSSPILFASLDPTSTVSHAQVDLASLPDGYNEQTTYQWYIAQLAAAFGVDYQEFAPLPTSQNLGSSQQSEVLHMKTRGKGPATIMRIIEHLINNNNILPKTIKFAFKIQDLRAETEQAEARFARGKDRTLRLERRELDIEASIEMAILDGDLPEHIAEGLLKRVEERRKLGLDVATGKPLEQREGVNGGIPSKIEQGEAPQDEEDESSGKISARQVGSGSQSADMKATDIDRRRRLLEMRQSGELEIDLPEITEEDIENQRRLLGKKMLGNPVFEEKLRLMGPVLEGEIHRHFTNMADMWFTDGKLSRSERIELSRIIGDVLDLLHNELPADIAHRPESIREFVEEFQLEAAGIVADA